MDPAASTAVYDLWEHLDEDTRGHLVRVGRLARDLARHIGLTAEEQAESGLAGLLHDIGKLGIPHEIVAKAAPLNLSERRLMHSHPETGARSLGAVLGPEVVDAIRHHHERMDGRGYPDGAGPGSCPWSVGLLRWPTPTMRSLLIARIASAVHPGRPAANCVPWQASSSILNW